MLIWGCMGLQSSGRKGCTGCSAPVLTWLTTPGIMNKAHMDTYCSRRESTVILMISWLRACWACSTSACVQSKHLCRRIQQ